MSTERRIQFEGIPNSRELGGIRTADGRVIRRGLLLRTANLSEASEEDLRVLRDRYRLSLILDLRTTKGQRRKPDLPVEGAVHRGVPVFEEEMLGISHGGGEQAFFNGFPLPDMEVLYRNIILDEGCRGQLGKAVRSVMEHDFSEGSVLWHCSEGKDRCGMVSALVLTALGAAPETVMEDYLLSNETSAPKAELYYRKFLESGRGEAAAQAVRNAFLVKKSYLDSAVDAVTGQYGGVAGYLSEGLQIPEELILSFREKVLEPSPAAEN